MTWPGAAFTPPLPSSPPRPDAPLGALERSIPELDRRVDQLEIALRRYLDEPGPLVGQPLHLAGLDRVEGPSGDRLRAVFRHIDQGGHAGVYEASVHALAACTASFRLARDARDQAQ